MPGALLRRCGIPHRLTQERRRPLRRRVRSGLAGPPTDVTGAPVPLTGADVAGSVPLREPAYKVTVALDRQDVTAYGQRVALKPDMLLKADIVLDSRSFLAWLLDPLFSARIS